MKNFEFKLAVLRLKTLSLCRIQSVAEGLNKYIHAGAYNIPTKNENSLLSIFIET